jgi:hypothetical protein
LRVMGEFGHEFAFRGQFLKLFRGGHRVFSCTPFRPKPLSRQKVPNGGRGSN